MKRPFAALLFALLAPFSLIGCVAVEVGNAGSLQTQLVLEDASASAAQAAPTRIADALLIQGVASDPQAESVAIAYSRRQGERALYQLSVWTERPARRVPVLLQRRLETRGTFGTVALLGQPVASDLLLTIAVDEIYHDVSTSPGQVVLALQAALYDRRERRRIAKQRFAATTAAEANAASAAAAMSQALGRAFDELVPWLEREAARVAPPRKP